MKRFLKFIGCVLTLIVYSHFWAWLVGHDLALVTAQTALGAAVSGILFDK